MAIKEVKYSKKFLSQTGYEDISHHGSPKWRHFQKTGKEDEKFREEIVSKYALSKNGEINYYDYFGFDGNQQYKFWMSEKFSKKLQKYNIKENGNYSTHINITKAGNGNSLEKLCDL